MLCVICTVKANRFYIPGETKLVERLRKESFDKGIIATLTFIYKTLHHRQQASSVVNSIDEDIMNYIKTQVLNPIELNDLVYHAHVIEQVSEMLKVNPDRFKETFQASGEGANLQDE